jgi:hypothetical protein
MIAGSMNLEPWQAGKPRSKLSGGLLLQLGDEVPAHVSNESLSCQPNSLVVPPLTRDLGRIEGQNLVVERRLAEGKIARLPARARELAQLLGS